MNPQLEWAFLFVENAIFSRIHRFQHTSYADIEGMSENGYEGMPLCKRW